MVIEINGTQNMNEKDQWVFMTIKIDDEEFKFIHVAPCGLEGEKLQKFVDAREDRYKLDILRDLYPNSDYKRFMKEDVMELEAMLAWIEAGHKNQIIIGYYKNGNPKYGYRIIEKQEWRSTHPPELKLTDKIDRASITPDLKSLLKDIIMR